MMANISERITDLLVDSGAAPAEDKALYEFGIRQGILLVINIGTAVLIGLIMGMFWQSIIFLLAYNPVRTYSGGYHARTPLACYLLTIPITMAVLMGIKMLPWNGYICAIVLLCAVVIIEILAPVADPNKPLNEREKVVYKKRARNYSAVFFGAALMLWVVGMKQVSLSIMMALGFAAVMLVLGAIKNGKIREEKA